jgi:hypothetical protein
MASGGNKPGVPQTPVTNPLKSAPPATQGWVKMLPGTVSLKSDEEAAVVRAIAEAAATGAATVADYYSVSAVRDEGDWLFVSTVGLKGVTPGDKWSLMDNGSWFGLTLVHRDETGSWVAAVEGTPEYSRLLAAVPTKILDAQAKESLDPLHKSDVPTTDYPFPWQTGTSMQYGQNAIHAGGFYAGWKAVDLLSDGNTSAGHAPNQLLASLAGTISYVCNDGTSVAVRIGDLLYVHLLNNGNLYSGRYFGQSIPIGSLRTGSFNAACGYATQQPNWFHVHWAFPDTGTFTAGGWSIRTYDAYPQAWTRGGETRGVNGWFQAGTSGNQPPAPVSNQRATALDSTRIQVTWNDAANETGYRVYEGGTLLAYLGANSTSYVAANFAPGSYHCFYVIAYNAYGSSGFPGWSCATTATSGQPPAPVSNQRASALDANRIQVAWNDSPNETGYRVYESGNLIATLAANNTSYIQAGLAAGSYHCYYVIAYNAYGSSTFPGWSCATTSSQSGCYNRVANNGFEGGSTSWGQYSSGGYQLVTNTRPHTGGLSAFLGGFNYAHEYIYQSVTIPSNATSASLSYWWYMTTQEVSHPYDYLYVQLRNSSGGLITTLATRNDGSPANAWVQSLILLSPGDLQTIRGQTVQLRFEATTDVSLPTSFFVDDINFSVCQ